MEMQQKQFEEMKEYLIKVESTTNNESSVKHIENSCPAKMEPEETFDERAHARTLVSYEEKREMELKLNEQPKRRISKPYATMTDEREQAKLLLAYVEQRGQKLNQREEAMRKAKREAKREKVEREKAMFNEAKQREKALQEDFKRREETMRKAMHEAMREEVNQREKAICEDFKQCEKTQRETLREKSIKSRYDSMREGREKMW